MILEVISDTSGRQRTRVDLRERLFPGWCSRILARRRSINHSISFEDSAPRLPRGFVTTRHQTGRVGSFTGAFGRAFPASGGMAADGNPQFTLEHRDLRPNLAHAPRLVVSGRRPAPVRARGRAVAADRRRGGRHRLRPARLVPLGVGQFAYRFYVVLPAAHPPPRAERRAEGRPDPVGRRRVRRPRPHLLSTAPANCLTPSLPTGSRPMAGWSRAPRRSSPR